MTIFKGLILILMTLMFAFGFAYGLNVLLNDALIFGDKLFAGMIMLMCLLGILLAAGAAKGTQR